MFQEDNDEQLLAVYQQEVAAATDAQLRNRWINVNAACTELSRDGRQLRPVWMDKRAIVQRAMERRGLPLEIVQ
jgi:hypothetical protein